MTSLDTSPYAYAAGAQGSEPTLSCPISVPNGTLFSLNDLPFRYLLQVQVYGASQG